MEKLVRRHFRKEPGHLACRAGPIPYALLLTLVAFSTSGAQSMGPPAKVVRGHALARAAVENHTIIIREEIAETESPAVDAKRERVIVLSTGPYLPITGALPLRFSSTRKWPSPLPRTGPASEAATSVATTAPVPESRPSETPAEKSAEPATPKVDRANPAVVVTSAASTPQANAPAATALTSDMVLGFLGDLPPTESRVSVRFEPALPQGATGSAGMGALSP